MLQILAQFNRRVKLSIINNRDAEVFIPIPLEENGNLVYGVRLSPGEIYEGPVHSSIAVKSISKNVIIK